MHYIIIISDVFILCLVMSQESKLKPRIWFQHTATVIRHIRWSLLYILEVLNIPPMVTFFLASLTGFTNVSNLLFKIYSFIIFFYLQKWILFVFKTEDWFVNKALFLPKAVSVPIWGLNINLSSLGAKITTLRNLSRSMMPSIQYFFFIISHQKN